MADRPITYVYIDGFNLYYGAVKDTPYKWLDLRALCHLYLPRHEIRRIKYFTARVSGRPDDPEKPNRQAAYLRALGTLPELEIHFGHFLMERTRMRLADPPDRGPKTAEVIKTSEKGSDVNLATHLLLDCFEKRAEVAVVVSNDSDLYLPIAAAQRMGCPVGLINPHERPSRKLQSVRPLFVKNIREGALRECQFPSRMRDARGEFHKPTAW